MGQCGPHPHISSAFPWGGLFTIVQGMAATLGRIFSSAFSVLIAIGASMGELAKMA